MRARPGRASSAMLKSSPRSASVRRRHRRQRGWSAGGRWTLVRAQSARRRTSTCAPGGRYEMNPVTRRTCARPGSPLRRKKYRRPSDSMQLAGRGRLAVVDLCRSLPLGFMSGPCGLIDEDCWTVVPRGTIALRRCSRLPPAASPVSAEAAGAHHLAFTPGPVGLGMPAARWAGDELSWHGVARAVPGSIVRLPSRRFYLDRKQFGVRQVDAFVDGCGIITMVTSGA